MRLVVVVVVVGVGVVVVGVGVVVVQAAGYDGEDHGASAERHRRQHNEFATEWWRQLHERQ